MAAFTPKDVDPAVLLAAWRKLGGSAPPTPRQEARLRDALAYAVADDRRRRLAAHTLVHRADRWPEIKEAYRGGQSLRQIAAWCGTSHIAVRARLLKMGVRMRTPNGGAP